MKLFFILLFTGQTVCLAQYTFGRGVYLGLDLNYQKEYLTEVNGKNDNKVTNRFEGNGRSFGIDLVYALSQYHFLSLGYKRESMTINHDSKFFIYSNDTISKRGTSLEFNTLRADYSFFFKRTSIFVSGGFEVSLLDVDSKSVLHNKYEYLMAGVMTIGTRTGNNNYIFLPYASYAIPLSYLREMGTHSLSLAELRLGLKIMFKLF